MESARLLIEAGADINLANSSGNTPLSVAARNGHTIIVKLLLEAGALVNTIDTVRHTFPTKSTSYQINSSLV